MKRKKKRAQVDPGVQRGGSADKPATALMKFQQAVLSRKAAPSRLPTSYIQAKRYYDYVYIHQQSYGRAPEQRSGAAPGT